MFGNIQTDLQHLYFAAFMRGNKRELKCCIWFQDEKVQQTRETKSPTPAMGIKLGWIQVCLCKILREKVGQRFQS